MVWVLINKKGVDTPMENYPVAQLSVTDRERIKQLEQDLGVILIAYHKDEGEQLTSQEQLASELKAYVDDPNINLI